MKLLTSVAVLYISDILLQGLLENKTEPLIRSCISDALNKA